MKYFLVKWLEEGSFSVVSEKSFTDLQSDVIAVGDVHNVIYKKKCYEAKISAVGKLNDNLGVFKPWLFFLLCIQFFSPLTALTSTFNVKIV